MRCITWPPHRQFGQYDVVPRHCNPCKLGTAVRACTALLRNKWRCVIRHTSGWSLQLQVGRQEPVMVLRVDKEKGYIDLSKRRVSPEDIAAAEERYNKSKMVCAGYVAFATLCRLYWGDAP